MQHPPAAAGDTIESAVLAAAEAKFAEAASRHSARADALGDSGEATTARCLSTTFAALAQDMRRMQPAEHQEATP